MQLHTRFLMLLWFLALFTLSATARIEAGNFFSTAQNSLADLEYHPQRLPHPPLEAVENEDLSITNNQRPEDEHLPITNDPLPESENLSVTNGQSYFFHILRIPELRMLIFSFSSAEDIFSLIEAVNIGSYEYIYTLIINELCHSVSVFELNYIESSLWRECEDQQHKCHDYRAFTYWFCEDELEDVDFHNIIFNKLNFDDLAFNDHIRGVPMKGMIEYKPLVTVSKENIKFVISYVWEQPDNIWHVFGELMDGSVFYFNSDCCYTGFDAQGNGLIRLAPTWESLFRHMSDSEMTIFIENLNLDDLSKKILSYAISVKSSDCTNVFNHFLQALMLRDEYESYKSQIRFENQKLRPQNLPSYIN